MNLYTCTMKITCFSHKIYIKRNIMVVNYMLNKYLHTRLPMRGSRNFFQGGGGGGFQARRPENSLDNIFIFSPQLILQFTEGIQWFYNRGNYIFEGSRGGPTLSRRGFNFFQGGLNANFYRNPYNL